MQGNTQGAKPHVVRVEMPDGTVRLIGTSAAARWLGCSKQALGAIARGSAFYPPGMPLEKRAREEFPALFGQQVKTEGTET